MKIFDILFGQRQPSASVAKERLQIVLHHERASRSAPDFLPLLQREIMAVVGKYLDVSDDMIQVELEKRGEISVLEINVELDKTKIKPRPPERKPVEEGFVRWTAPAG